MRKMSIHAATGLALLLLVRLGGAALAIELNAAFNSINSPDIEAYIDILADDTFEGREAGSRGGRAAGVYLAQQFQQRGLKPAGDRGAYFQEFDGVYRNILGVIDGSDPSLRRQFVLVGAHYDHVGYGNRKNSLGPIGYIHNGADDNASGVAGLLEVVEAFKALGEPPKRSVLFALWDGEEKALLGSKHWTNHPTAPIDDVVCAFNVDMIGRMRDRRVEVYGTRTARGLRKLISRQNQATDLVLDFKWDIKANSDHHSFYTKAVPFLMIHTGLHKDFHRPTDDPDKINFEGTEQATKLLFLLALELANRPEVSVFRDRCRHEATANLAQLERPLPARPPRLGVWWESRSGERSGLYLSRVLPDSPAERAGLRVGDRLVRFGGRLIEDEDSLRIDVLAERSPTTMVVERADGESSELPVELAGEPLRLGISWREDVAEPGTLILSQVVSGSAAHLAGLRVADRIYAVEGREILDGSEFLRLLPELPGPFELQIERRGQLKTVTVDPPPAE